MSCSLVTKTTLTNIWMLKIHSNTKQNTKSYIYVIINQADFVLNLGTLIRVPPKINTDVSEL